MIATIPLAFGTNDKNAVTGVAATRSGGPLAAPLLRNEEVGLHPLQRLHLRIAAVVNACHGDCQSFYRRATLMRSEMFRENMQRV